MNDGYRDEDRETEERRTSALLGLIVILSLAIIGILLVRQLDKKAQLEDCLLQGRSNCAPIELSTGQ